MPSLTEAAANNVAVNGGSSSSSSNGNNANGKMEKAVKAGSVPAQDPANGEPAGPVGQLMQVVDKKVRNLEKRKVSHLLSFLCRPGILPV